MPQTIRTPFNQGGTIVADPYDQIEESNRNAAMRAAELTRAGQGDDLRSQIALQQLANQRYEFGQGRADNMAMHREDRAAAADATKSQFDFLREGRTADAADRAAQFDYMKGRDTSADTWRKQLWEAGGGDRENQANLNKAATALQILEAAKLKSDMERQNKAEGFQAPLEGAPEAPDETQAEQLAISQGQTPAAARNIVLEKRKKVKGESADIAARGFESDVKNFDTRDNVGPFEALLGGAATDAERINIEQEAAELTQAYIEAGDDPVMARNKANTIIKSNIHESTFMSQGRKLLKNLGIP